MQAMKLINSSSINQNITEKISVVLGNQISIIMFNLQKRIKGIDENREYLGARISVRDKLLNSEISILEQHLRDMPTCKLTFSKDGHHEMDLTIKPIQGMYKGGIFKYVS